MYQCPKCNQSNADPEATFCSHCGCQLDSPEENAPIDAPDKENSDDFIVTETSYGGPDFVGNPEDTTVPKDQPPRETQEPDVSSRKHRPNENEANNRPKGDDGLIGSSAPPLPMDDTDSESVFDQEVPDQDTREAAKLTETGPCETTPRSPQDVQGFVSANERERLLQKLEQECPSEKPEETDETYESEEDPALADSSSLAVVDSQEFLPPPRMAGRGKALAYFFRNYVQLSGNPELQEGDELLVAERSYELRPRQLNNRWLVGGGAFMSLLFILIVSTLFVGENDTGAGRVVGIVLDEFNQPYIQGATIHVADLNRKVESNAQGFFQLTDMPAGPHEFEFRVGDELVGKGFVTVVDSRVSTMHLLPNQLAELSDEVIDLIPSDKSSTSPPATAKAAPSKSSSTKSSKKKKTNWSRLELAANIADARLIVDGEVLGRGNITYAKLAPGKHRYTVDADGYTAASGTVVLEPGRTSVMDIALSPSEKTPTEPQYTAEDVYYLGLAAASDGDLKDAIDQFSKAVALDPSLAKAYEARSQAYLSSAATQFAFDDCLRAAEIYRVAGQGPQAISSFNQALEIDEKSVAANLGRADLYLAMGQPIAALADFDAVVEIDKNNFQAHIGLGRARFAQHQYKRAIKHFNKARKIDSKNPEVHQHLMLSYMASDNFKEVKKSFEKFQDAASDQQIQRFREDQRFGAILRVVEAD